MCMIIKNLADDPLKVEEEVTRPPSRESMLEETIDKIGSLLQMGFGTIGSLIMGPNFTKTGEMNLYKPGEEKQVVIVMCRV